MQPRLDISKTLYNLPSVQHNFFDNYCFLSVSEKEISNYFNKISYDDSLRFSIFTLYSNEQDIWSETIDYRLWRSYNNIFSLTQKGDELESGSIKDIIDYLKSDNSHIFLLDYDNIRSIIYNRFSCTINNYADVYIKTLITTFFEYFSQFPLIIDNFLELFPERETNGNYDQYINRTVIIKDTKLQNNLKEYYNQILSRYL